MNRYRFFISFFLPLLFIPALPQPLIAEGTGLHVTTSISWDTALLTASARLDLAEARIKLPAGRAQAEELCVSEFPRLILPHLFALRLDSSTSVGEAVAAGALRLSDLRDVSTQAPRSALTLSSDLAFMSVDFYIDLKKISALLIKHEQASAIRRPLEQSATRDFSGLIIYAETPLPLHGTKRESLAKACLFPKLWDDNMNLLYERNMADPATAKTLGFAHYTSARSMENAGLVGNDPLRILATSVFGAEATDLVIAREDALKILASEANRNLLKEGRVVIVLSDTALTENP